MNWVWACLLVFGASGVSAGGWQQRVHYVMDVTLDVETHHYTGLQELTYYNFSPDTLTQAFFHLYYNAFRPGSVMDMYNRDLPDPDPRLLPISLLEEDAWGALHVTAMTQNGQSVKMYENGTILEVELQDIVLPGDSVVFLLQFEGRVPVMIRRAGRDNAEGIAYSMSQWYPKICAYDEDGWHPNPYVSREFYADFGDFDVSIRIDTSYVVAAGGVLQEPNMIGHGYEDTGVEVPAPSGAQLCWRFIAKDVHDFVWAADPDYRHVKRTTPEGVVLHFFYQDNVRSPDAWEALPDIMTRALAYINAHFGKYPFETYAFIQGGDAGMEYPMATLITGNRGLYGLVSVCVHEWLHSWYQMVLATNESLFAWMDEGFTEFGERKVLRALEEQGLIPARIIQEGQDFTYLQYYRAVESGIEEPLSTHADHFSTNSAYFMGAYVKGFIFLNQLEYIIGEEALQRTMIRYFNTWKFRHPRPLDFIRVAEKESGMVLDWYYEYWILTTKTIDYAVSDVTESGDSAVIILQRKGAVPMPVEVRVKMTDGQERRFYIPLDLMRGQKPSPGAEVLPDWQWTDRTYMIEIPVRLREISEVALDPGGYLADTNRSDNLIDLR